MVILVQFGGAVFLQWTSLADIPSRSYRLEVTWLACSVVDQNDKSIVAISVNIKPAVPGFLTTKNMRKSGMLLVW